MYTQYGSPFFQAGKGCAKSEGGSGCIVKRGGKWAILNNKKGGIWRDGFNSEAEAEKALAAYHANSQIMHGISQFYDTFFDKSPFKNVEEPAKNSIKPGEIPKQVTGARSAGATKPMSESEKKRMKATQSVTDKTIKEQDYDGQHGVIIGKGAPEMSPLKQGGYEGAADIMGAATYIPTASMYADMFSKIGQAVADIDANKKKKDKEKKFQEKYGHLSTDSKEYKDAYVLTFGIEKPTYKG